ncbi:O-acyltransferase like protein-like [Gryllus bimaculatus]|nr:O-acyltransferase like protein-like [Gryllus bimaculatus]
MALTFLPLLNRSDMLQVLSAPWAVFVRTGPIYTDSFLLLSSLLTARQVTRRLDAGGPISVPELLASRTFRIAPNMAATVLFYAYLLPSLGSGPQWGLLVEEQAKLCRSNMWRHFLFIHNLFGFKDICLPHTHHLAIDMQLFLLTLVLVTLVWRAPRRGAALLGALAVASSVLRFSVAWRYELSTMIYYGTT